MSFSDIVIPIFTGPIEDEKFDIKINYGTAFPIAPNVFVTANHSVSNPPAGQYIVLGYELEGGRIGVTAIKALDRFDYLDIAIVETYQSIPNTTLYKWYDGVVPMVTDVMTVGYAYSLNNFKEFNTFSQKAFKGYVVGIIPFRFFDQQNKFSAYELSFQAPKGQSGAPVLIRDLHSKIPNGTIIGVIIGSKRESIEFGDMVETHTETIEKGREIEIVRTIEATHFGVAVQSAEILPLYSEILGRTVREYLQEKDLIVKPVGT